MFPESGFPSAYLNSECVFRWKTRVFAKITVFGSHLSESKSYTSCPLRSETQLIYICGQMFSFLAVSKVSSTPAILWLQLEINFFSWMHIYIDILSSHFRTNELCFASFFILSCQISFVIIYPDYLLNMFRIYSDFLFLFLVFIIC